jgi:hypothetical protein
MYGTVAGGSSVLGGGALAVTGFDSVWAVVAGVTLVLAGLAVMRLAPRWSRRARV